jgi:cytochrome c biogenesis factor
MVLTTEIQIAAFIGAVIGVLVGTLAPYYNKKKELGWNDVDIFFDKAFLKATFVALILATVGIGGSFPMILANVPPEASIITTLIGSAVFAMTMNFGGNAIIGPSKVTLNAKNTLLEKTTVKLLDKTIEQRLSASDKINHVMDNATVKKDGGIGFGEKCDCQKCSDKKTVEEEDDDGYTTIS